jgi:cytochrome c oxidase subunit 4
MMRASGVRALGLTLAALLGLTALSYALSFVHIGRASVPAGLTIAAVKVSLVGLYFMHLVHSSKAVRLVVATVPVFVLLLVGLVLGDVGFRALGAP